ncbi:hypothetical protein AAMO2058_000093300 [Amorphochlora amoebiformis]
MASLVPSVEKYLIDATKGIIGLHAVHVADRDGLTIAKTSSDQKVNLSSLSSTFSSVSDQASKLNLGQNKTIITFLDKFVVVQTLSSPLVITFVGSENLNVGAVKICIPKVKKSLAGLREKVESIISSIQ